MEQLLQALGVGATFSNVLLIWALVMARLMPVIIFAPFIGGDTVPSEVKLGIGMTLSLLVFPFVAGTRIPASAVVFIVLMVKEVFIGYVVAFAATAAFEAARSAGTFVDTVSGANQATVFVPQLQQQASLFADLQFQLTLLLFLALNGHLLVIRALIESFRSVPINGWPSFGHGFWPLFEVALRTAGDLVVVAVALGAPAAISAFITDITLGMVNRVAPQVQVFFISMSIKPLVVTAIAFAALPMMLDRVHGIFHSLLSSVRQMLFFFS